MLESSGDSTGDRTADAGSYFVSDAPAYVKAVPAEFLSAIPLLVYGLADRPCRLAALTTERGQKRVAQIVVERPVDLTPEFPLHVLPLECAAAVEQDVALLEALRWIVFNFRWPVFLFLIRHLPHLITNRAEVSVSSKKRSCFLACCPVVSVKSVT